MIFKRYLQITLASISLFVFAGCATTETPQSTEQQQVTNNAVFVDERDPFEPINRGIWDFNWNILDRLFLKPAATAYAKGIPQGVRTGLMNVALNLEEPVSSVNNLLQGHVVDAGTSLTRFVVNSSVGLLGFFDVADSWGLERHDEQFGEVLATYGVSRGPFLMLPVRGPSDGRNLFGDWVDSSYLLLDSISVPVNIFRLAIVTLETRAAVLSQQSLFDNSIDSYSLIKDLYYQKEAQKQSEHLSDEELDAQFDDEFDEDIDAMLDDL